MSVPSGQQLSRDFRSLAQEQRARRIDRVRGAIHVNHYAVRNRLNAALDRLIDSEGFTSHAPVMKADDAAMQQLMDDEFQLMTETDR